MSDVLTPTVVTCVGELLNDPSVQPDTSLLDLPGFTSLVIADLIDRLELEIGAEVPPELIVPETFESPATIATALRDVVGSAAPLPPAPARVPARALHDLLDAAAADAGSHPALRAGDATWTYAELRDRSIDAAAWLVAQGIGRHDRVIVGLGNAPESLIALYALSRLGAVYVPVDPDAPARSLGHLIADVEPALVLGAVDPALVAEAWPEAPVRSWPERLDRATGPLPAGGISTDAATILYTSGTTGRPKGIVGPHRAILFAVGAIADRLDMAPTDTIGCVLPLTFDYGLFQAFLAATTRATLALGTPADAGPGLPAFLERHGVTGLPVVPSLAASLVKLLARQAPGERPPLRWVTNTGAAFAPALAARLAELCPDAAFFSMYGLTECKRVSILRPDEHTARPTSVGRPLDDTEVFIVDPATGRPCAPGEVGEIVVRGPHLMDGYWGVPAQADVRFRPWGRSRELALFTGDLGHLDAEGYLYVEGRDDGLYKVSGFRVSVAEVELAASEIDGVIECAALPPTEERPPTLAVVGTASGAEVRTGLLALLEPFKVPEAIVVVDELPHNGNGKVDRRALAEQLEAGR